MHLTRKEQELLDGEGGVGMQKAMELLVALGRVYDAERLIPIASAHLSGVSYKTMGEGGLSFVEDMAKDARVSVRATLNPAGMDLDRHGDMGITPEFASKQLRIIESYRRMGVETTCTCTPYLTGHRPGLGEHIAWAESNALSFANSVLGARTNREGGPGALAAAVLGVTPEYGLHLDANRAPSVVIEADIPDTTFDHTLLGNAVGSTIGASIPYYRGISPNVDSLKTMGAAMAASGSVALYHVEGVTPEADAQELDGLETIHVGERELEDARCALTSGSDPDLVTLGCPHLSVEEVRSLAGIVEGKGRSKDVEVWFCTSRDVRSRCQRECAILDGFGKLLCDTCMVVAPIEGRHSVTGTNSAKACNYLPTLCSQKVVCSPARELLEGLM